MAACTRLQVLKFKYFKSRLGGPVWVGFLFFWNLSWNKTAALYGGNMTQIWSPWKMWGPRQSPRPPGIRTGTDSGQLILFILNETLHPQVQKFVSSSILAWMGDYSANFRIVTSLCYYCSSKTLCGPAGVDQRAFFLFFLNSCFDLAQISDFTYIRSACLF